MHAGAVKSKYNNLDEMRNSERNILRKALVTTANQFIPSKAKQKKKLWMTDGILDMMKKGQKSLPKDGTEY